MLSRMSMKRECSCVELSVGAMLNLGGSDLVCRKETSVVGYSGRVSMDDSTKNDAGERHREGIE